MLKEIYPALIVIAVVIFIAYIANHYDRKRRKKVKPMLIKYICSNCGYMGSSKILTKGSCLIELILWFFFIIPGLIYTIWRISSRQGVCPACQYPNMIPANTPRGQKLIKEFRPESS